MAGIPLVGMTCLLLGSVVLGCAKQSATAVAFPRSNETVPDRVSATTDGNTPVGAIFYTVPFPDPDLKPFPIATVMVDPIAKTLRRAQVDCSIDVNGYVQDCKLVSAPSYSRYFAQAVYAWLLQPALRFHPMTLAGVPIAGRHVFDYRISLSQVRG